MKRLLVPLCVSFLGLAAVIPCASRAADNSVTIEKVWDATRVATNAVSYSKALELTSMRLNGYFSLQLTISASTGTVQTLNVQLSNNGTTWSEVDGASAVDTAMAAGTYFYNLSSSIPLAKWLRIKLVTTNDGATVTGNLAIQ